MACFSISRSQTVVDVDGNVYDTIAIGTQVWLKENLKVTHYNDGSAIYFDNGTLQWDTLHTGAYCYYNNDSISYAAAYGPLYNSYTVVDSRGLCPSAWHVPSYAEYMIMFNYLGGDSMVGGKLKDTGFQWWAAPNNGATNITDFSARAAGFRNGINYSKIDSTTSFWLTDNMNAFRYCFLLYHDRPNAGYGYALSFFGHSVRCIKNAVGTGLLPLENSFAFHYYPNPATDFIYVTGTGVSSRQVNIYSLQGKLVWMQKQVEANTKLDISALKAGIYIINGVGDNFSFFEKLIVE